MKVLVPDYLYCIILELKPRFYYYFRNNLSGSTSENRKCIYAAITSTVYFYPGHLFRENLKYINAGKKDRKLDFIKLSPPCWGGGRDYCPVLRLFILANNTELLKV